MPALSTLLNRGKNLLIHGAYIPTEYFVFKDHQIVYISIPKVACTSIKIAIEGAQGQQTADKEEVMNVHRKLASICVNSLDKKTMNYTIFAFVRNPFDRLVSCYEDKVKKPRQHNGLYYFDSVYNKVLVGRLFGTSFHPDMSFDEFIKLVSKTPDIIADGHFKSQYSSLYKHGKRIPHFVGKFETLTKDWDSIAKTLGLGQLSSNNKTQHTDWMNYYKSKNTIELVHKRYRKDIELFNYEDSYMKLLSNNTE